MAPDSRPYDATMMSPSLESCQIRCGRPPCPMDMEARDEDEEWTLPATRTSKVGWALVETGAIENSKRLRIIVEARMRLVKACWD